MQPQLIAKENIMIILPLVGKDIELLLHEIADGYLEYYDVVKDLYSARRQLWILATDDFQIQGWLVTRIQPLRGNDKRLLLDLFGGHDMDTLVSSLNVIEDWARSLGATESYAYSRPGLRKKLYAHGFRHKCDVMIKPLTKTVH